MKNGEEVSSTKYKNERLIFKGSPKQLDVETKSINIKHKYEKDSNFIIKNGNSKESNKFIKSRNLPNNTYDSDLVDKPAEYSKKPKYDTKYLPYESQGSETRNCADCQYDFTNYGSECCDSAWSDFGIDCATLESNYNWDCSGCACPGDDNGDCSGCLSECVNANTSEFCQNLECYAATWDCMMCAEEMLGAQQFCETTNAANGGCAEACDNVIDPDDCEDEDISGNVNGYQYESCSDLVNWLSNVAGYGGSACDVMWGGSPVNIMCPETCGLCDDGGNGGDSGCASDQFDCGNGQCIPASFACDGSNEYGNASWGPDCSNGADENLELCCDTDTYSNVSACGGDGGGCAPDQFDCYGDGSECISGGWVCDGSSEFCNATWPADCSNGADEGLDVCGYEDECDDDGGDDLPRPGDNCTGDPDEHVCPTFDFFGYVSGGECVPAEQVCDGIIDCYYYDGPFSQVHDETEFAGCSDDGGGSPACEDCVYDFTNYGSECCDTAWDAFGIDCATLEANYSWDCTGCACPGDAPAACGDGTCTGDEDYYTCPEDCNAPGVCDPGFVVDCVDNDCCPESWIGDGFEDCEDQQYGCNLTCYDNDGGDCAGGTTTGGTEDCEDNWDSCLQSLLAIGSEYYDACSAEDCQGGAGGACDGLVVPGLTDECGYAASNIANGTCPDPCGGGTDTGCPDGNIEDCADDDCAPDSWIADGYCDGTAQQYGADLCCYDLDGGDCTPEECAAPTCGDGACNGTENIDSCPEDCTPSTECDDCVYDWTNYGSECCDTAWNEFGIDCATLAANYGWDCTGCECPGDDPTLTK